MCAASTGGHFASKDGKKRSSNNKNQQMDAYESYASTPLGSYDPSVKAEDTFAGMSFASYAPNGSDSMPMVAVQAHGTPSETDEFLAISMSAQEPVQSQPVLTPAESPVGGPVNPLLAAQMAKTAAASGEQDLFPIQEVEPRKGTKNFDTSFGDGKSSKKGGVLVVIILLLVAALFAGGFFYLNYQEGEGARAKLAEAIECLRSTDDVIVPLDKVLASETGYATGSTTAVGSLLETVTTTQNTLSTAEAAATEASRSRDKLSASEAEALDAVLASISARRSMLEVARMVQTASVDADTMAAATESISQIYAYIATADQYMAAADALYQLYTDTGSQPDGMNLQDIVTNEYYATDQINAAYAIVNDLSASLPNLDLGAVKAYLESYARVLDARVQHDAAAIAWDWDTANSLNDWYGQAVSERQACLEAMPSADELVGALAGSGAEEYRDVYTAARTKCADADAVLGSYLGVDNMGIRGALPASADSTEASAEAQQA